MNKLKIDVAGMHCRSCEVIMEKTISKLPGVKKVSANQSKGTIEIAYEGKAPNMEVIGDIVRENGYSLGKSKPLPWLSNNIEDYASVLGIAALLLVAYMFLSHSGISFSGLSGVGPPTLGVAFIVGLTAGISSCMALVGGLILGISAKWNQGNANNSGWSRFEPHLYFNLGRILGFGFLGGLLGLFGSFVSISSTFLGIMTLAVAAIMLLLGVNLTNLSPRLANVSITLPKFLGQNVGANSIPTKSGAMLTGMATFFLPCGFTLAMQMYAISTGSFITGALAMALFALGTAPGLIGIGGLTAFAKGSWAKRFFRFTGVIVLLLGFFNAANAYNLLSLGYGSGQTTQNVDTSKLETEEIRMTQDDSGYSPNIINVKPNSKIRLIVDAKSPYSCSSTIVIPSVGVSKRLVAGENIIEFVSPSSGEVRFSCSMGMYTGKFVVSDSGSSVSANTNVQNQNPGTSGSSKQPTSPPSTTAPSSNPVSATKTSGSEKQSTNNGVETIRLAYTSNGLSEQTINVKKGKSYKILIDVKDTVSGCMSRIVIPGLDENIQSLTAGNIVEFNIRPTENGQFPLTCAMGVPHGYINVE